MDIDTKLRVLLGDLYIKILMLEHTVEDLTAKLKNAVTPVKTDDAVSTPSN